MNSLKYLIVAASLLLLAGCKKTEPAQAPGGCGSDKDCKGDRICASGQCVAPKGPGSVAPRPTRTEPAEAPIAPSTRPATAPTEPTAPTVAVPEVPVTQSDKRLGAKEPLVVITEFGDLQCPYCARATTAVRAVLEKHGKPGGTVAFEWRHNPLDIHPKARELAVAAEAANKQGRFWQFHDQIFQNQKALGSGDLKRYAQLAGLDLAQWEADCEQESLNDIVTRDRHIAMALQANGTPTFFINGRLISGVRPVEELMAIVEEELAKGRAKREAGVPALEVAAKLQRENNADFATYIVDGKAPPVPASKQLPIDETVWQVLIRPQDPARGPADALVTIVEFGDFECPFCARYNQTLTQLADAYPKDVRVVWKNNPQAFHKNARQAAEAALAAHAQGKFWEYHDRLFDRQDRLSQADLLAHGRELGLDATKLKTELESGQYKNRVESDLDAAARTEAVGTPVLFVNGRKVVGARELKHLKTLVEAERAKAALLVKAGTPRTAVYQKIVAAGKKKGPLGDEAVELDLSGAPDRGAVDAPLQIVVWADFQCPFSSRLVPILERAEKRYAGKTRLVFKHFPQDFHPHALDTAGAGICAQEQGRFWDMHNLMMDLTNQKDLSGPALLRYANKAGLKIPQFKRCLAADDTRARVGRELAQGKAIGVKGTPTVYVNGRRFNSPTGYNDRSFARLFDGLLERKQEGQ